MKYGTRLVLIASILGMMAPAISQASPAAVMQFTYPAMPAEALNAQLHS